MTYLECAKASTWGIHVKHDSELIYSHLTLLIDHNKEFLYVQITKKYHTGRNICSHLQTVNMVCLACDIHACHNHCTNQQTATKNRNNNQVFTFTFRIMNTNTLDISRWSSVQPIIFRWGRERGHNEPARTWVYKQQTNPRINTHVQ